jgi:glycosyltransferase involved in cell wall biosynthesis
VEPDEFVAATVAVLRPGKGIGDLLDAAAGLGDASPIRFVIAGSGPEEAVLLERARDLGLLGRRVSFVGFVDDVSGLLAGADLLVHPSHRDALPTAVLHGMAAGLPIVATRVGGTPEIVTEEIGLLVDAGDPGAVRSAVETLAEDPDGCRWMGKRARERFENEFSVEVWARRLRSLYERVLREGV